MRAGLILSSFALFFTVGASVAFAQSDRPSNDELLAKISVLNEAELDQAIQAGSLIQDKIYADLSKKEKKRLARLGQKMWEDCPNYFDANNLTRAPRPSVPEKQVRLLRNSTKRRSELFKNIAVKISDHPSYKQNSDKKALQTLADAKKDSTNPDTQLWAAANSMRCTIELTKLAGTKNKVAAIIIQKPFVEAKKSVSAK